MSGYVHVEQLLSRKNNNGNETGQHNNTMEMLCTDVDMRQMRTCVWLLLTARSVWRLVDMNVSVPAALCLCLSLSPSLWTDSPPRLLSSPPLLLFSPPQQTARKQAQEFSVSFSGDVPSPLLHLDKSRQEHNPVNVPIQMWLQLLLPRAPVSVCRGPLPGDLGICRLYLMRLRKKWRGWSEGLLVCCRSLDNV